MNGLNWSTEGKYGVTGILCTPKWYSLQDIGPEMLLSTSPYRLAPGVPTDSHMLEAGILVQSQQLRHRNKGKESTRGLGPWPWCHPHHALINHANETQMLCTAELTLRRKCQNKEAFLTVSISVISQATFLNIFAEWLSSKTVILMPWEGPRYWNNYPDY